MKAQRGFTMVEVLIAAAILAFSMVGLGITTYSMARNRGLATAQIVVGQLATEYLNEYVQWGYGNLTLNGSGTFPVDTYLTDSNSRSFHLHVDVNDSTSALSGAASKQVVVTLTYTPGAPSVPITQVSTAYVSP